jgi:hypothetical protein
MVTGVLAMDPKVVVVGSNALAAAGDGLAAVATPSAGPLPEVPEDRHGLREAFSRFEAARVADDLRFAEGLQAAAARSAGAALDLMAVDGAAPLPDLPRAAAPGRPH